ncbi:HTH merR-type domain-containing protein [Sphingomonas antarctica]|uniref:MerR family transcriptional regulator n=1 Tax=Sphingomonas antarctica TaxID=2040274 RepID=UPI0039EBD5DF
MKTPGALRTIGEVSAELGVAQHILRYWESRFPQLKPLTRAGNRRYYRPEDLVLLKRIDQALNRDGYTVKGVQQLLAGGSKVAEPGAMAIPANDITGALIAVRDQLRAALAA